MTLFYFVEIPVFINDVVFVFGNIGPDAKFGDEPRSQTPGAGYIGYNIYCFIMNVGDPNIIVTINAGLAVLALDLYILSVESIGSYPKPAVGGQCNLHLACGGRPSQSGG